MKNIVVLLVLFVFSMLSLSSVNAALNGSLNLNVLTYNPSESISGSVNLNLAGVAADSIISASVNGVSYNMTVLEFLQKNNANFSCNPANCKSYFETSGFSSPDLILSANTENYIGFKLETSGVTNIEEGLQFDIKTLVSSFDWFTEKCGKIPINIDLLDDNEVEWEHIETIEPITYCGELKPSDCYSVSGADKEFDLGENLYCEKMSLNPSSGLKLGAELKKVKAEGYGNVELSIYDSENATSSVCQLSAAALNSISKTSYSIQTCDINFTIKKSGDYYVCANSNDAGGFAIKGESKKETCGYLDVPMPNEASTADYGLYAQIAGISKFTGLKFNDTRLSSEIVVNTKTYFDTYLLEKYNNDCSKGCIIPISIYSEKRVQVLNAGLKINYASGTTTIKEMYKLDKKPVLLTMQQRKLDLSVLNIKAPSAFSSTNNLILSINGQKIGEKTFLVVAAPKIESLNPQVAFAGLETIFRVIASSPSNSTITSYSWDFGDGITVTTKNSTIKHTYAKPGIFNLSISATDKKNYTGTKTFEIKSGTSKEAINYSINSKKEDIAAFSIKLDALSAIQQTLIKQSVNIEEMSDELSLLEKEFKAVVAKDGKDEDYFAIKTRLDEMHVPVDLIESAELKETSLFINTANINPEYIKELGGGNYDSKLIDETKQSIAAWQSANVDIKLSSKTTAIIKDDSLTEDVYTLFTIKLTPKQNLENVYLAVNIPSGVSFNAIKFLGAYGQKDVGAIGIKFDDLTSSQTIEFALPGSQDMLLDVFASADLDNLEVVELTTCGNTVCEKENNEDYKNCPDDCKPTTKALTYIVIVIFGGALGVFLIWKFYAAIYDLMLQRKFFKTRKDYINLLIYISECFKKSQTEQEIRTKLKTAGWNQEQIDYAMLKSVKAQKKLAKKQITK